MHYVSISSLHSISFCSCCIKWFDFRYLIPLSTLWMSLKAFPTHHCNNNEFRLPQSARIFKEFWVDVVMIAYNNIYFFDTIAIQLKHFTSIEIDVKLCYSWIFHRKCNLKMEWSNFNIFQRGTIKKKQTFRSYWFHKCTENGKLCILRMFASKYLMHFLIRPSTKTALFRNIYSTEFHSELRNLLTWTLQMKLFSKVSHKYNGRCSTVNDWNVYEYIHL